MLSVILATVIITSTLDTSPQPALFYTPPITTPVPLLVALHTWGGDYTQVTAQDYAAWCAANGWAFIHPNFRGPNNNPAATGSPLAIQDIIDAIDYAKSHANISRVYLLGGSGGGHAALLVYAQHPDVFNAASVWVPITDLVDWYNTTTNTVYSNYARDIAASTGGPPGASVEIDEQYAARSPLMWLTNTLPVTLSLNVGIFDGHTGSVPVAQSLWAFNALAQVEDRISAGDIAYITTNAALPIEMQQPEYYTDGMISLFKRTSNNIHLTLFDGTHEIKTAAALEWLRRQEENEPEPEGICYKLFMPILHFTP